MKKIIFILTTITCIILSSCTDLNVAPNSKLTDANAFQTKSNFINGLSNVYAQLTNWSTIVYKFGCTTDEMIFPARGGDWKGDLQPMYLHNFTTANGEINGGYSGLSNSIAIANSFIGTIENFPTGKTDPDLVQMENETRFLRAFFYFLMMDNFGNVPLVKSAAYDPKNPPAQATRADIYAFVESELTDLSSSLPKSNIYGRVDQWAAKTLLAKLYLNADVYLGSGHDAWDKVATLTQDVMTNSGYVLENDYKKVFAWDNFNSKEMIFPMVCDSKGTYVENISSYFSLFNLSSQTYGPAGAGWGGASALPAFYRSYDSTDVRRLAFAAGPQVDVNGNPIIATDDSGVKRQFSYNIDYVASDPVNNADHWDGPRGVKYLMDGFGGTMVNRSLNNDMPILRFADVLMMRAEALFRLNNSDPEALALVNEVRTRNGNNPVAAFTTLTADELLAERGREFAWEGWRKNDLIRFGEYGKAWDYKPADPSANATNLTIFPIPQVQIDANPNLKQNPGY